MGSLLNPSLEIKEKAGGGIWGGRAEAQSWGLGGGSGTKASTLTGLGWGGSQQGLLHPLVTTGRA